MSETASKNNDFKQVELTPELYQILIEEEYKYLVVRAIEIEDDLKTYIFKALKELPTDKELRSAPIGDRTIKEIVCGKIPGATAMIQVPVRNQSI